MTHEDWEKGAFDMPRLTQEMARSGEGEALKRDARKDPMELLPLRALREVSKVYGFGAGVYGADNWRKGMAWRRMIGANLRHLQAFADGEDVDPETGLCHLTGATFSLLCLLEYWLTHTGTDDRWRSQEIPNEAAKTLRGQDEPLEPVRRGGHD